MDSSWVMTICFPFSKGKILWISDFFEETVVDFVCRCSSLRSHIVWWFISWKIIHWRLRYAHSQFRRSSSSCPWDEQLDFHETREIAIKITPQLQSSSLEMLLFDEKRRRREIEKVFIIRAAQSSIQSKNNKKIFRLKRLVMREAQWFKCWCNHWRKSLQTRSQNL